MRLFSSKPAFCTVCKKQISHKHKPKREWHLEAPLCGECYVDKMKEYYDTSMTQSCAVCGIKSKVSNLWEPRWQWEMEGLLCKNCFDKKEISFSKKKDYCSTCGIKLGFFRYNPKNNWKIEGQLCKNCWDEQKEKNR